MKKYVYFLTSCLLFSQAVQAGKYFDVKDDGNTIVFKKSGHKFKGALSHVLNHVNPCKNKIHLAFEKEKISLIDQILIQMGRGDQ